MHPENDCIYANQSISSDINLFFTTQRSLLAWFHWAGTCHCIEKIAILWAQLFIKRRIEQASHSENFFSFFIAVVVDVANAFIFRRWRALFNKNKRKKSLFSFESGKNKRNLLCCGETWKLHRKDETFLLLKLYEISVLYG